MAEMGESVSSAPGDDVSRGIAGTMSKVWSLRAEWSRSSFLAGLEDSVLAALVKSAEPARFERDDELTREGEPGNDVFLLLTSYVKVTTRLPSGDRALLAVRTGGDLIGE